MEGIWAPTAALAEAWRVRGALEGPAADSLAAPPVVCREKEMGQPAHAVRPGGRLECWLTLATLLATSPNAARLGTPTPAPPTAALPAGTVPPAALPASLPAAASEATDDLPINRGCAAPDWAGAFSSLALAGAREARRGRVAI